MTDSLDTYTPPTPAVYAFLTDLRAAERTDPVFRLGGVYCSPRTGHVVEVRALDVHQPGQGHGRKLMARLLEIADRIGVALYIQPEPGSRCPMTREQLSAWYQRCGFAPCADPGRLLRPSRSLPHGTPP